MCLKLFKISWLLADILVQSQHVASMGRVCGLELAFCNKDN